MTPTPEEIDAVIFEILAADHLEAAQAPSIPSEADYEPLWWSEVFDREGKYVSVGCGLTPADARASAWVNIWYPEGDLQDVSRIVPEGWTFEVYPPDESAWNELVWGKPVAH